MLQIPAWSSKVLSQQKDIQYFNPHYITHTSWGALLMRTRLQELLFSSHLDFQAFGTGENSPESKIGFFWGTIYIYMQNNRSLLIFLTLSNIRKYKYPPSPPVHPREECSPRCSAHWSADQRRSTWKHHKGELVESVAWRFTFWTGTTRVEENW